MWKACNAHLLPGGGRHGGGDVRAAVAPPATPGYGNGDAAAGLALRRKRGARPRAAPGGRRRRLAARSAEKGATGRGRPGLVEAAEEMRGLLTGRLLDGLRLREGATRLLDAAALKWGPGGLLQRSIALFLAGFLGATIITANTHPPMALAAAAVLGLLPLWYVRRKGRRRVHSFEEQFPDCLEFVARSMRAGHAFSVAIEMAHREFRDPLGGELRRTFEEQNLGQPLEIVLRKLSP